MPYTVCILIPALAALACTCWAQEPATAPPAGSESHPPYFNYKARQFLIEGSHSIAPQEPIQVGNGRQLMFDRFVIDDAWGCERTVHQPEKYSKNPVLPGLPQFARVHFGSSFLYDQVSQRFRLWACSWNMAKREEDLGVFHSYYESEDLLHWTAPALGIVDYEGSTANNVINAGRGEEYHGLSVFQVPLRLRSRGKYAMCYLHVTQPPKAGTTHGLEVRIAWSEDGYRWKDQPENPVIRGRSDTFNNVVYNPERDVFMMYRRPTVNANQIRRVAYSESKDLVTWTQPQTILLPDEAGAASMFYSMAVVPYQGIFIGFLQNYYMYADDPNTKGPVRNGPKSHQLDIELAWSRDGLHWERHPKRPVFLETGVPGSYDAGMVYLHQGLFEKDGRISLLYSGNEAPHVTAQIKQGRGSHLALATLRQDGFVSLDAPKEGYALTKPLRIPGGKLHINAQTEPGGFIRVALRRGDGVNDGEWIAGWTYDQGQQFEGDSVDAALSWKGAKNLDSLKSQSVRLHFWMNKARLYSFWME